MIGLPLASARLALPVSGAIVLGVGLGTAVGWLAGGTGAAPTPTGHARAVAATFTGFSTVSILAAPKARPAEDAEAVSLLRRAAAARTSIPWSGTQVVTTLTMGGPATQMVALSHQPGQATDAALPLEGVGSLALLTRTYSLSVATSATEMIAGRPTQEVIATRADHSVAARFWVDQETGLLLRRDVLDRAGSVIQASVFVSIDPGHVAPGVSVDATPGPWPTEVSEGELAKLRSSGWACPASFPGGLALYDIRRTSSPTDPVLHLAYSDGLVNVSVFEERGHLDSRALQGYVTARVAGRVVNVRPGAPLELTWQSGGTVFTVVTDTPDAATASVVANLPAPTSPSGGWSRVRRGLHRMGSWVDPSG